MIFMEATALGHRKIQYQRNCKCKTTGSGAKQTKYKTYKTIKSKRHRLKVKVVQNIKYFYTYKITVNYKYSTLFFVMFNQLILFLVCGLIMRSYRLSSTLVVVE